MKMTNKRRKLSSSVPIKMEIKEENITENDYLMAKGRLKGVLMRQLKEQTDSSSDSSDDNRGKSKKSENSKKRKADSSPTPLHHTYVMKLFDRSVDLARFQEDTPLYPICRAWMQNQPRNPHHIIKRRLSSPEPDGHLSWNGNNISEVHRLPGPSSTFLTRIPPLLPEQLQQSKESINLNYTKDCPAVPKDELIRNHLTRWVKVRKEWIKAAAKNEERYSTSLQILQAIYNNSRKDLSDAIEHFMLSSV